MQVPICGTFFKKDCKYNVKTIYHNAFWIFKFLTLQNYVMMDPILGGPYFMNYWQLYVCWPTSSVECCFDGWNFAMFCQNLIEIWWQVSWWSNLCISIWCQSARFRTNSLNNWSVVVNDRPTMLQKLSNCEVKAWLCWNLINLLPLRFYVKSNFGEFKRSNNVIFGNFRNSEFWF